MLRFPNSSVSYNAPVYWTGDYSNAIAKGAIEQFVLKTLAECQWTGWYSMPRSDGDITMAELTTYLSKHGHLTEAEATEWITTGRVLLGTVAYRMSDIPKTVLLPQDDTIFIHGLTTLFPREHLPAWESRKPLVFWRGACSCDYRNQRFLRREVVKALLNHPGCDVKLVRKWHEGKDIPDTYFGDKMPIQTFLDHRYLLILDGNGISSSHMWVFASGAVPILISNNEFWFKPYLISYKNYVPIKEDLSDLYEVLDWLFTHPEEAKQIADGAYRMASIVFSTDFQRDALRCQIESFCAS
jgi:hypothetical protein